MQRNDWDPPEVPGVDPVMSPSILRWLVAGVIVVGLALAAFLVPLPGVYAFLPGPVRDVETHVEITGAKTFSSEGSLYLTTVSVDTTVTFADYVETLFDPDKAVVDKEAVTGGNSPEEAERIQRQQMAQSKRSAEEVALEALGFEGPGARIVRTVAGEPAHNVLKPDDVIFEIDGKAISSACDAGIAIREHEVGDLIRVTVERDGRLRTFRLELASNPDAPGHAFLGIEMRDPPGGFDPNVRVEIDTDNLGGPSAGLMFSLAIYDQLTPDDLTKGRSIAGTGTIQCDGHVGAIGGIEQKVSGAERRGAEIFLSPVDNLADAKRAADDIEVVAIDTFTDAIDYLEGL